MKLEDLMNDFTPPKCQTENQLAGKTNGRRSVKCFELSTKYLYRRAFSEVQLLNSLKDMSGFQTGYSYHSITAGDVDAMSYLRLVMLYSGKIKHLLISTWVMSEEDVRQFEEWLEAGRIEKADFYVGEIFPGSYVVEYSHLKEFADKYGRIAVFRNHSKIIAGEAENFYFVCEMSANINTNPRTEQGVITIDKGLYEFYKAYFDDISSFE